MAITITVTNAGRAALVNAANTGTNAVTITQMGVTETAFVPNAAQAALPGEVKRINAVAGVVVADDAIHVTVNDVSNAAYAMRGFAFYLNDGTLFAVYGQAGAILNKTAESLMLLALDIAFADVGAALIEFGDTNFVLPLATTEIAGLVELATTAEAQAGADAARALTPITGRQSVLGWILTQDGSGSGLDADLLDGLQATAFVLDANFVGGNILSRLLTVDGSGSGLDADLLDGLHAAAFALAGHTHGTIANQNANAVAITGGAIDGTAIGNAVPSTGKFTTITASGNAVLGDGSYLNWGNQAQGLRGSDADGSIRILTSGIERMRVTAAGLVGINTNNPQAGLEISHADQINARLRLRNTAAGGRVFDLVSGVNNATQAGFSIYDALANASRLVINSAGNVGIGTGANDAYARAEIVGAADAATLAVGGGAGSGSLGLETFGLVTAIPGPRARGFLATGDSTVGVAGDLFIAPRTNANASIRFMTGNGGAVDRMTINSLGNVGIGQFIPAARVHVKSDNEIARFETTTARGGGGLYQSFYDPTGRKGYMGWVGDEGLHFINEMNNGILLQANGFGITLQSNGYLRPNTNNAQEFGGNANRWSIGHFGTSVQIAGQPAWHAGNDGPGSGLDADLLDGRQASEFVLDTNFTGGAVLSRLLTVDGAGSGLDADLLDGFNASDFLRVTSANVAGDGHIVFSNGLKLIWGRVAVSQDMSSYVTYPFTFDFVPTVTFPSIDVIQTNSQENTILIGSTVNGFTVYQAANNSGTMPYHVIGR